ncbi:MAG: DNA primase [Acidobacteriota bacterium]|nr:MAG: DNA primase [Acidobacteriota bacterium]
MMRFPRGFSDELRNQADILRIIGDYVSLKKKGSSYWACCPFHNEKSPSFHVNPGKQFFKCFGCGKAGDVFSFVMEIEGCPFPEAVKTVAEKSGVQLPRLEESPGYEERDRLRSEILQINQWATEFFEENLIQTTEGRAARAYLEKRGISDETRRAFRLGYAPNKWDACGDYLKSRGATRSQIEQSGLVTIKENRSGYYDRFRGRLMFPICDTQGRVVAFGGRLLGDGEPKYLNSPETAVYTKGDHLFGLGHSRDSIRRRGHAVLVEGYLDFLIPFQAGVTQLVASLGTALTESQVRLLGRYTRRVVVNFDPDSAGVAATKRSLELLVAQGFQVNVLTLPDNLDPDEYIRAHGPQSYLKILKSSQPFLDYIVQEAIGKHDQSRPEGKVETINAILPYLRLVRDRIERAEQFERIADRLRIDSKLIREEFKKAADTRQETISDRVTTSMIAVKPAEKKLLECLLNHATIRRSLLDEITDEDLEGLRTRALFNLILDFERQGRDLTYPAIVQQLDDQDLARDLLPSLMHGDDFGKSDENSPAQQHRSSAEREARESLDSLRSIHSIITKKITLQSEINQAMRTNDPNQLSQEKILEKYEIAKRLYKKLNEVDNK